MSIRVLDPTFDGTADETAAMPRLETLEGRTIGLLDNRKHNVHELLNHMENILRSDYGVKNIVRLQKPDASRPAPPEVVEQMKQCEALISAVGD
jgi:hypothetical protein